MDLRKSIVKSASAAKRLLAGSMRRALIASLILLPPHAYASIFQGEALDAVANAMSWVVLVIVPIVAVSVFWLVHILPEKIAEQRHHPQAKAIQTLCLLSLFFGGMLWPLAWLWAYSKPVLYKMAYGTDKVVHGHDDAPEQSAQDKVEELERLLRRVNELEGELAGKSTTDGGKA
jgi:hypothetical protein